MENVLAVNFGEDSKAYEALSALKELDEQGQVSLDGAAVVVRGETRLTVKGPDGQIMLNRDLKSGDSYQVPDMPGLTMATSDAGAVEIDLDGIALGRAGQAQQIVGRVSLDPQSLADRFNNR